MAAILKRELNAYFTSGIAYVVLAVLTFFSGIFFMMNCLASDTSNMTGIFVNMFMVVVLVIPVLTMRLFTEEKKQKTDQALLTAPVNLFQIVVGKFLSAVIVYALSLIMYIIYAIVITCFTTPDWTLILCNILGMFLLGCAIIAVCIFISSLTESQVVAAVSGIAVGLIISFLDTLSSLISVDFISTIISAISFSTPYQKFTVGIINLSGIIFFLSVCVIFLFLTIRVLEKRRWS